MRSTVKYATWIRFGPKGSCPAEDNKRDYSIPVGLSLHRLLVS